MKRKMILFAALVAASSTAFVSCSSSDDDLAQEAPKAPVAGETVVEESVVVGTPFSVAPSNGSTRAVRYGSSAWGDYVDNSTPYVNCFKLYGKQSGIDAWMNHMIFTRAKAASASWTPNRDATGVVDPSAVVWPTTNTGVATDFYAITDNDIKDANDASWPNGCVGLNYSGGNSFTYTLQPTTADILWDDPDDGSTTSGIPGVFDTRTKTIVDRTKIRDLMYATTTMTEADVTNDQLKGQLPLPFHHALSGLSIQAQYISGGEYNSNPAENGYATVKAVYVCGLNTSGTFTMNPVNTDDPVDQTKGGSGEWSGLGTPSIYYYELPGDGEKFDCINNTAANVANPSNRKTIVPIGEWLVIPQTTTAKAWNQAYVAGFLPDPSTTAYIILDVIDKTQPTDHLFLCYPLDTTFNPGKTRVITVDIAQGRCCDLNGGGLCDLYYYPGDVIASRKAEMDLEENK